MELMGDLDVEMYAHCDGFINNGRTMYANNFYTGVPIEGKLLECKTRICDTISKKWRGLQEEAKQKPKKREVVGYKVVVPTWY